MTVFEKGIITILVVDLVLGVIAIPLILRKVPRNVVYGFRTRATLSDDFIWYEANAHFGRGLLIASVVTAFAALILYRVQSLPPTAFLQASIVALVLPTLVATIATARFIRSLTPGGPSNLRPGPTPPRNHGNASGPSF
jgi:uncharacterized membrane protein